MLSQPYLVGGLVLVLLFAAKRIYRRIQIQRFQELHGCKPVSRLPQSERILGVGLYKAQLYAGREKKLLEVGRERYLANGNTWSGCLLGQEFVNTIEPENIKTILTTRFKDFGIGGRLRAFGGLLGEGIFTTDGAQWEHSRALMRPNFTRAQVADLNTFETHIKSMLSKIPRDGLTVDLQALFFKLTLDSATQFLFGESVKSLDDSEGSESDTFGKAFDHAQSRLGQRARLGNLVYILPDRKFDEACSTVHKFVDKIVFKALEKFELSDVEKLIDGDGQPQRYIFLAELLNFTRDPKRIRDELLNVLLAGRDTTASLLSNTFHVLARRRDIWKRLAAEVDTLYGQKPTYENLKDMKYLKYILNESLRLYPVVPANIRFAIRDTVLPSGGGPDASSPIFIPKGGIVAYHPYHLHRRTDIYGADALEFRPERWESEENLRPGWGYIPFNGGPRICLGQQFALIEASYTIVRLVQEFSAIEDRDGTPWVERLSLTVTSDKGVNVGMIPR